MTKLTKEEKESRLSDLAIKEGIIHVKSKKPIKAGQVVTTEDVDLNSKSG